MGRKQKHTCYSWEFVTRGHETRSEVGRDGTRWGIRAAGSAPSPASDPDPSRCSRRLSGAIWRSRLYRSFPSGARATSAGDGIRPRCPRQSSGRPAGLAGSSGSGRAGALPALSGGCTCRFIGKRLGPIRPPRGAGGGLPGPEVGTGPGGEARGGREPFGRGLAWYALQRFFRGVFQGPEPEAGRTSSARGRTRRASRAASAPGVGGRRRGPSAGSVIFFTRELVMQPWSPALKGFPTPQEVNISSTTAKEFFFFFS